MVYIRSLKLCIIRDRTHQIKPQLVLKNNENKILDENNIIVNCRKRTRSLIVGDTMNKICTTKSRTKMCYNLSLKFSMQYQNSTINSEIGYKMQ